MILSLIYTSVVVCDLFQGLHHPSRIETQVLVVLAVAVLSKFLPDST